VSRKICNNVKSLLFSKDAFKDGIREVEGVASELIGHIQTVCTVNITDQLGQAILVEVNDHNALRLKAQHSFDEAGAYGSGTSYNTNLLAFDFLREYVLVRLDVGGEHADRTEGYAI